MTDLIGRVAIAMTGIDDLEDYPEDWSAWRATARDAVMEVVDYLHELAEGEATGSRDFGRGFGYARTVLLTGLQEVASATD